MGGVGAGVADAVEVEAEPVVRVGGDVAVAGTCGVGPEPRDALAVAGGDVGGEGAAVQDGLAPVARGGVPFLDGAAGTGVGPGRASR